MSKWESHELQQREMKCLTCGEGLSHVPVHNPGQMDGKQLCRKRPKGPGGQKADLSVLVAKAASSILD